MRGGRFLIDPDGVIPAMEVMTPPVGRKLTETIRRIRAFQLVRETEGKESDTRRMGARSSHPRTRPRPHRQGLGSLEPEHGEGS
jgi:peroxiredoxin (alkyl hydroperoxide reductase subunit C)